MPTSQPDACAWARWEAHLVDAVTALADGESLTLSGADSAARPVRRRAARLGGLIPARHEVVAPWVRLDRVDDLLRGRCVGAGVAHGGGFPLSPDEEDALTALGWHRPGPLEGEGFIRFWPDDVPQGPFLPQEDADRAAAMVAATFREVLLGPDAAELPALGTR